MQGELTPEQQLQVLTRIWGRDRDGYVFLPYIEGTANTTARRRRGYHEGRAYEWPKEKPAILDHLKQHESDDLYFTPALFNGKRRVEQNVDAERALWADLDPVDPSGIPSDYRPTIAWESSPGRYQAVWLTNVPKVGASWASNENHRLSLYLGADPSGWDSTQLLRVPGRRNFKFSYRDEGDTSGSVPGRLLWTNGPRYTWEQFDSLPAVGSVGVEDVDLVDEDLLHGIDRHAVWSKVRLKVSHRIREYMGLRTQPDGADRSSVLWEIERELADAGCSVVEIVALIRPSIWNKYAGRNDELKRLKLEAAKAIAARTEGGSPLEDVAEEVAKPNIRWLSAVMADPIPRPRWLVRDIWTKGGCGFIAGAPKSYKSWMALDLAISVATGTFFLNQPQFKATQANVLYLQEEDDLRLVTERLESMIEVKAPDYHWKGCVRLQRPERRRPGMYQGARRRRPVRVTWGPPAGDVPLAMHVQTGFIASDPAWQAWLSDIVSEGKFELVVIDTLGTTAGDVDTDRSVDLMHKLLIPLKVIAKKQGVGISVVHHNRKSNGQGSERAGNAMLGSVALHAWVDCALYARSKDDGVIVVEREAKLAPDVHLKIKIPKMYVSHRTGDRQLWEPELLHDDPESAAESQERKATHTKAGASLAAKMRAMGMHRSWQAADVISDRFGHDCTTELLEAVANGFVEYDAARDLYRAVK